MKRTILVVAIAITNLGVFAQSGLNDLKGAAKDVEKSGKEAANEIIEEKKTEVTETATEMVSEKETEIKSEVAEKVNVDVETVDNTIEDGEEKVTEVNDEKLEQASAARDKELEEMKGDETKIAARKAELESQVLETEEIKEGKKTSLIEKITVLKDKIAAAESKLGLLEKAGISPDELVKKTEILNNAKAKLASLTSFL